jgi:hypothetical protein
MNDFTMDPLGIGTNPFTAVDGSLSTPIINVPGAGSSLFGSTTPGTLMGAGNIINAFSSIASSIFQSNAIQMQAKYQAQQLNFRSQIANIQAQAALSEGENQAEQIERGGQQQVGSERANEGASGVNVNSGSAMATQQSTQAMTGLDALTARNNAARQAWGYQVEATQEEGQAQMGEITAQGESNATLLTGGLNAFSYGAKGGYYASGGAFGG